MPRVWIVTFLVGVTCHAGCTSSKLTIESTSTGEKTYADLRERPTRIAITDSKFLLIADAVRHVPVIYEAYPSSTRFFTLVVEGATIDSRIQGRLIVLWNNELMFESPIHPIDRPMPLESFLIEATEKRECWKLRISPGRRDDPIRLEEEIKGRLSRITNPSENSAS